MSIFAKNPFLYELMNIGVTLFEPVAADCEDPDTIKEK